MPCPIDRDDATLENGKYQWNCRDCTWAKWAREGITVTYSCKAAPYIINSLPDNRVLWGCRACDWTYEGQPDDKIEHVCGEQEPRSIWNLGDAAEAVLKTFGITQERVTYILKILRDAPTCRCEERKEAMNKIGQEFGKAVQLALDLVWRRKHG